VRQILSANREENKEQNLLLYVAEAIFNFLSLLFEIISKIANCSSCMECSMSVRGPQAAGGPQPCKQGSHTHTHTHTLTHSFTYTCTLNKRQGKDKKVITLCNDISY
jgi:hypothetical protein